MLRPCSSASSKAWSGGLVGYSLLYANFRLACWPMRRVRSSVRWSASSPVV
jgi:hypothetical protein